MDKKSLHLPIEQIAQFNILEILGISGLSEGRKQQIMRAFFKVLLERIQWRIEQDMPAKQEEMNSMLAKVISLEDINNKQLRDIVFQEVARLKEQAWRFSQKLNDHS